MGFDYSGGEVDMNLPDCSIYEAMNFISQFKKEPFFLYYGLGGTAVSSTHEEIDEYIGKLLSCLADREMLDNTLIVFPVIAARLMITTMFHFLCIGKARFLR